MKYHIILLYILLLINFVIIHKVFKIMVKDTNNAIEVLQTTKETLEKNNTLLNTAIKENKIVVYKFNENSSISIINNSKEVYQK